MSLTNQTSTAFNTRMSPLKRWAGVIVCIVLACITAWAAQWQYGKGQAKQLKQKAQEQAQALGPVTISSVKRDLEARLDLMNVRMSGTWQPEGVIYLDNRPATVNGAPRFGVHVLMPLKLKSGMQADQDPAQAQAILVNRGWFPNSPSNIGAIPVIQTPPGEVQIEGLVRASAGSFRQSGQDVSKTKLWSAFDYATYERMVADQIQLKTTRWVVLQTNSAPDQLLRDWPAPSYGIEKHMGYAFQWAGMFLVCCVFLFLLLAEPWLSAWRQARKRAS